MVGLQLDFTPVQPSHLRHVFTPRSPASPLESIAKRIRCTNPTARFDSSSDSGSSADSLSSGSPPSPCKWMWYCHQCRTGYELGVTRRCLIDDHQLCYGQPVKKRSKKGKKKHQACQSEFDYTGWQSWGVWKRMQAGQEEEPRERNCSANCDWLSQCRWARKQEQSVENNSREAVEEVVQEAAQDDTAPQSEQAPVAARNDDPAPASKPADGPLSSIATAARKLTSQWASLLAPIPEEPASVSVEEFLDSAKTKANPTEGAEQLNPLQRNPPAAGPQSNVSAFDFDFDFGFSANAAEETPPSLSGGLHDLVARTVGIALFVPSKTHLEQRRWVSGTPSLKHKRSASAPIARKSELRAQLRRKRRMSA